MNSIFIYFKDVGSYSSYAIFILHVLRYKEK